MIWPRCPSKITSDEREVKSGSARLTKGKVLIRFNFALASWQANLHHAVLGRNATAEFGGARQPANC